MAVAEDWRPVSSREPEGLVCEIDAKPAGIIGFLRIYREVDGPTNLRDVHMHLLRTRPPGQIEYRQIAGGLESRYWNPDSERRVFATVTAGATYVIEWAGLDLTEYRAGLPAYVLARDTLTQR